MPWNTKNGNAVIELIFVVPFVLVFLLGVQQLFQRTISKQKDLMKTQAKEKQEWIQKQNSR